MISSTLKTGVVAALIALATPAMAEGPTKSTELGAITVVAPRITYQQVRRVGGSVIPKEITLIQKTTEVKYGDLDLAQKTDRHELEDRIASAANGVCEELAREFPDGEPDTTICARRAANDAMAQLRLDRPAVAFRP